jgi:hypothetical protein
MSDLAEPSSFDPAIYLHSDQRTHSDFHSDIEAGCDLLEEIRQRNRTQGVVIQHRSWTQDEVPWSEPDRSGGKCTDQVLLFVTNIVRFSTTTDINYNKTITRHLLTTIITTLGKHALHFFSYSIPAYFIACDTHPTEAEED